MKFNIKPLVTVMLTSVLFSACSKYPTEGVIDTRSVREVAEVLEVTGDVYGIKEGGLQAAQDIQHDSLLLQKASSLIWTSTYKKDPTQEFKVNYLDQVTFNESIVKIQEVANTTLLEKEKELNAAIVTVEEELSEAKRNEKSVVDNIVKYKEIAGDTDDVVATLNKEKDELIQSRNDIIGSALVAINNIAKENSLAEVSSNPLSRYSSMDIKSKGQASCRDQKNRLKVNLIKEQSRCLYFRVPEELMAHGDKIASKFKKISILLKEVDDKLGKKGGWMSGSTGIYAQIKEVKKSGEQAKKKAEKEHGSLYNLEYKLKRIVKNKDYLIERLSAMKTEEYYNNEMSNIFFRPSIEHGFSLQQAREEVFNKYFVKTAEISKSEENNGTFSGVSSGFEMLVVYSDILASYRGAREAAKSLDFIDLTTKEISNSDQLEVKVERRKLVPNRQKINQEEFIEVVLKLVNEEVEEKA